MRTQVTVDPRLAPLLLGIVEATGVDLDAGAEQVEGWLAARLEKARSGAAPPEDVKPAIRRMLRRPLYKPSGRAKPASEFLLGAAERDEFPRVNPVVDLFNGLSLTSGFPISLLDLDAALPGATLGNPAPAPNNALELRLGREGERYVFNHAGHEIELEDLLLVARAGGAPLGNPVKDSMATKTSDDTRSVIAFVYASTEAASVDDVSALLARAEKRLLEFGLAKHVETAVLRAAGE